MYELIAAGVVNHLATGKAAEGGGNWVIDEEKDPGITNDYRTVGGAILLGVAALTRNRQLMAMAGAGAAGLGFSYLSDDARRRSDAKPLGAPMKATKEKSGAELPMQFLGYAPTGQPIYGYVNGAQGQQMGGASAFGCAPTQQMAQPPGPWATPTPPPWYQGAMSGQAPLASPFT